jgi:hypothetical protein
VKGDGRAAEIQVVERGGFPSPLRGGVGVGVVRLGERIGETGAVSTFDLFI